MKFLNTIFILLIFSYTFAADQHKGLSLDIKITRGETSKDSHQFDYTINITNRKVIYSGPYGQCMRGQCEHKKIEFDITADKEKELIKLAESCGLYDSFRETARINDIGNWVKASLSLKVHGTSSFIIIEGMTNNWSKRGNKSAVISSVAGKKLSNLDRFCTAVKDLARLEYSEFH